MPVYAGFWRRVAAFIIDYIILLAGTALITFLWSFAAPSEERRIGLVVVLLWVGYKAIMESSPYQATAGKLALGIMVTDSEGNRIGIWRALGRLFASIVSALILYIGFIMAGFTRRRQALHDLIADTLVVKRGFTPSEVASAGDAPSLSGWAVAGLVLVAAAIPLLGIVGAIAVPAYQDYTIRAQIAQGLNLASAHKAAVAATWDEGKFGFDDIDSSTAGIEELSQSDKYVTSIEITSGAVVITYGSGAAAAINGRTLTLIPALNEEQEIAWVCGYGAARAGYEVIFEDHAQYTDVPAKYLPAACRGN